MFFPNMSKKKTTPSYAALAEKERMKDFMAYRPDRKAEAELKKLLDAYRAPEIASNSGALKSQLGDIKP